MTSKKSENIPQQANAVLILADGSLFWGKGIGLEGQTHGELCFNTSLTGYQEILTDPSYAGQIITFTFPHIGNVGTNPEDNEAQAPASQGLILRTDITHPSNWRAKQHLESWLTQHKLTGICGVDTRQLTHHLRDNGAQNGLIFYSQNKNFNLSTLRKKVENLPSLTGQDLAKTVTCGSSYSWQETTWDNHNVALPSSNARKHVVVIDYGVKQNILRCLASEGFNLTIVPASTTAEDILKLDPDGIFLSNGPGDPEATGKYAVPTIKKLLKTGLPLFGICLGHQMLVLALGGQTEKMFLGHRGANHPVKDLKTNKIDITSQNHGFHVLDKSLPDTIEVTHVSLFDGTNEGIQVKGKPIFSVQFHPEASPGPEDSHYLFKRFAQMISQNIQKVA